MNKKSLFTALLLITVGGIALVWLRGFHDPTKDKVVAKTGEAKFETKIDVSETDVKFALDADNTEIKWTGSNAVGQTPHGFFYELSGEAVVDPSEKALKHFEFTIAMDQVKAMNASLTEKLKHKGFFEVDKFPQSRFVSTSISKLEDTNQVKVEGNFQLRDETKSISFPAEVSVSESGLTLKSEFSINRKDYGVVYENSIEDAAIRDDVLLNLEINVVNSHGPAKADIASKNPPPKTDDQANDSPTNSKIDPANLAPQYTETIPKSLVEFDLVLVPGDESKSIQPFYIGKTEVTWDEFGYWALCEGISEKEAITLREKKLRPSAPHDMDLLFNGWGRDKQPAIRMSRLAAELYCQWLSEQTGKKYRLPTAAEWETVYVQGGGNLAGPVPAETLSKQSWYEKNSFDEETFDNRAMPIGTREANSLGVFDLLGNVAEWVTETGDEKVVRGGSFMTPGDQLSGKTKEAEDQAVWNKNYPNTPKSVWWYVDADYVGFRVVCEP